MQSPKTEKTAKVHIQVILFSLALFVGNTQAETLKYACMDTWRGYLSHNPLKEDEAVVQDNSTYHPKTFRFEHLDSKNLTGIKNDWLILDCTKYNNDQRDLLDCSNDKRDYLLHLDVKTDTYAEWQLISGKNWSTAIMSRGKCSNISK